MLEKVTELGAARIVPVIAERTDHGLDRAAAKRVERWRKIVLEASQQCRRMILPEVDGPIPFAQALSQSDTARLFLDEAAPRTSALKPSSIHTSILIGPEGGWPAREREQAIAAGWTPVSLGPRILRAETAAIAAMAILGQEMAQPE